MQLKREHDPAPENNAPKKISSDGVLFTQQHDRNHALKTAFRGRLFPPCVAGAIDEM